MRKYFLLLCLLIICAGSTGCASLMRAHYNADFKQGVNLVSTSNKPELNVNVNGKDVVAKRIYDGSANQSPFYVYRAPAKGSPKLLTTKTQEAGVERAYTVNRKKSKGWFWMEGVLYIFDVISGGLFYYPDVPLE
ncbi:MAG: hypothetical protein ACXWEY_03400 [Bacteroidia bacterium]